LQEEGEILYREFCYYTMNQFVLAGDHHIMHVFCANLTRGTWFIASEKVVAPLPFLRRGITEVTDKYLMLWIEYLSIEDFEGRWDIYQI